MADKKNRAVTRAAAEDAVRTLLRWAGDDPLREGLRDTPKRVVNAYGDWFSGYSIDPGAYLRRTFEEVEGYDEMVVLRDISFESFCEHHMAPIIGRAHVGYLPTDRVVGISKLARVVDGYARRFQVQEKLTAQIAACINEVLKPRGVGVVIDAVHQCMTTRGVHKRGVSMITSKMLGTFRADASTRAEFLRFIDIEGARLARISCACARLRRVPASSRPRKLYLCFSPGCSAPTPTTWRAIFSPRSLVIEITTQYSQLSPRSAWRIDPSIRIADTDSACGSAFEELKRRW